jgi:ADP-L-glycero-D-manno-heptose 6-epimerase
MVYASSAATYGDGAQGFDDDFSLAALERLRPLNLYGWTKHAFDLLVAKTLLARREQPPQWAGLKFFNVYGPNEGHKGPMQSVAAQMWPKAARGEPVSLFKSHRADYADGGQERDFVYVRDAAEVVAWLVAHESVNGVFNLGSGVARSFKALAEAVFSAAGQTPRIDYVETPAAIRDHYQYFTRADMTRLRAAGYTAEPTSLEEGVADYVQSYLARPDPYR